MKHNFRNSGNGISGLFSRLTAEEWKAVVAVCLLALTVFLWARMLVIKGRQNANAAAQMTAEGQSGVRLKISFIELPVVEGRNDVLARDFFTVDNWRNFMRSGEGKSTDNRRETMDDKGVEAARRVAEKLELETIMLGEDTKAFINNKQLSVGDKLHIGNGADSCECEVTAIEENTVFIRCGKQDAEDVRIGAEH
jgi:hypothetical protein